MKALALVVLLFAAASAGPVTVGQDQFAAARAFDAPAVRTYGFSTCVALFLYDSQTRVGGVAHISASSNAAGMVESLLGEMVRLGARSPAVTAQLFGGWNTKPVLEMAQFDSTSPLFLAEVKRALARRSIRVTREETLTVPFKDDGRGLPAVRSMSLDLATGVASDYQP